MQCSLQDFAIGGYILEYMYIEYLRHNLVYFGIWVYIYWSISCFGDQKSLKIYQNGGTVGVVVPNRGGHWQNKGVQYPSKMA